MYGELQAGSYIFMDADYSANQAAPISARGALLWRLRSGEPSDRGSPQLPIWRSCLLMPTPEIKKT